MMDGETHPPKGSAPLTRKLATILCADIAGYSQKMGADEERTVQVFRGHREVFESLVNLHQGRIFNTAGDALLVEFNSAVEAVRCATEIQSALSTRNAHLPPKERLQFRIGINVGDVIVQDQDLLGDGVNVAARIQAATEPGGICISGSVFDQIQNKLSLNFKPLGEQTYKNIAKPVRTYTIAESGAITKQKKRLSWKVPAAVAAAILIAGAGYWGYRQITAKRTEQTKIESQLAAQLAEQKKASEQAQRAAEDAKRDAQLQVQRQAADDALRRAQEERNRLEQDRKRLEAEMRASAQAQRAAEDAKREAQLQAQRQAAEDALRRAQEERDRLEQDRKRLEAERQAAESVKKQAAEQARHTAPAVTTALKSAPDYDGVYKGHLCNTLRDKTTNCWPVDLTVRSGIAEGAWLSLTKKTATAKGSIAADGSAELKLSTWTPKGDPTITTLTGRFDGSEMNASGRWYDGTPVSGHWKRAPTAAAASAAAVAPKGVAQYDGIYKGQFCSLDQNKAQFCWAVPLTVRGGVAEGSYLRPTKQTATVKGTVAADGTVELKLSSWTLKGDPVSTVLTGRASGDAIAASGQWREGPPISGNWTRAQ